MEPTFGIKFSLCRYVALNMSIAYEWDAVMQKCQSRNPDFPIDFQSGLERIQAQAGFDFLFEFKEDNNDTRITTPHPAGGGCE